MTTPNKHKELLFWIPAALIPVALMVAVFLQVRRPTTTRRALYIIGEPEKGAALFFGDKHCGICHSINGSGGRIAPDLSGMRPSTPAMGWLTAILWNHGPGMWRQIRQKNEPYPRLNSMYFDRLLIARVEVKYLLEKSYRRPCRPILNIEWTEFTSDRLRRRAQKLTAAPSEKGVTQR